MGFSLAWMAVLLVQRHQRQPLRLPSGCIPPITEVLYSIYRRRVRNQHPGMPDRLHFHSLAGHAALCFTLAQALAVTLRNRALV